MIEQAMAAFSMPFVAALPTAAINASESIIIPAGLPLQLGCLTSGTPFPVVSWSRDGMTLEADGSEVIIAGATLTLSSPSSADSGEYHCSAFSSAGLVSSSVQVLVVGGSNQTRTTEAVVRDNVVLECSEGLPAGVSVRWTFNDTTLAAVSDEHVVLPNGSLLILDLWVEDMGDYVCEAGQVQLTRTLNITGEELRAE